MVSPNDWVIILLRLVLALFFGAVIGWDRQAAGKPAGMRTHMLVSVGSALFVLVTLQLGSGQTDFDPSRVIQGVATGVGFLGAGEILHQSSSPLKRLKVRGLTSAAAIWISAALGVTAGCGLWITGLLGALIAVFILSGVKKVEALIPKRTKVEE